MARSSRAPISFAAATATARQVAPVIDRIADSLPVNAIQPSPRNPRQSLTGIDELAASIQAHGLMQPIVVRPVANGYELVAGHRRLEAARLLGWTEIAVIVRDENEDEAYILTLVENLQREDLSPEKRRRRSSSWSVSAAGRRARSARRSSAAPCTSVAAFGSLTILCSLHSCFATNSLLAPLRSCFVSQTSPPAAN